MFFLVNMWNHSDIGQRSLEDVIGIFGHQVRSLGHQIIWDNRNHAFIPRERGVNIVVEGFLQHHIDMIAEARRQGARFICIATEEPTPKGFNHGTQREMVLRQQTFPGAAQHFDAIFHLVPGQHVTDWYGQFAPTRYVELGYAPSLERNLHVKPDYEFGFYGSLTPRRIKILKKLANRSTNSPKAVKVMGDFKTQQERDADMSRCKVIVQIRKFEEMGLVSSSRCNTALSIGRPVVAEPHLLSKPWDEIVTFSDTLDDFYNRALLAKTSWQGIYRSQMERFKAKLPPEFCVGRPLEEVGIVSAPVTAAA